MSILRVDNFGPSAGGTTYSARGIAKAWCWVNDPPSLVNSLNCSSVTDNAVGDYSVTITSALSDRYGATALNSLRNASGIASGSAGHSMTSSSVFTIYIRNDAGVAQDAESTGMLHGDLA